MESNDNDKSLIVKLTESNQAIAEALLKEVRAKRRSNLLLGFSKLALYGGVFGFLALTANGELEHLLGKDEGKQDHIAVVNVQGVISNQSEASSININDALDNAFEANSKVVVLAIDSPGGSPVQSERVFRHAQLLKEKHDKDLVAVIGDLGASGGYYIASSADKIYAEKASMVGSIGVISSTFGFNELMDKLGIERRIITIGENKSILDPYSPIDDKDREIMRKIMNNTADLFHERVGQSRGDKLDVAHIDEIYSGKIFDGQEAKRLGLIDDFKDMYDIKADYDVDTIIDYSYAASPFARFGKAAKVQVDALLNEWISPSIQYR